jgi:hypothetical protein
LLSGLVAVAVASRGEAAFVRGGVRTARTRARSGSNLAPRPRVAGAAPGDGETIGPARWSRRPRAIPAIAPGPFHRRRPPVRRAGRDVCSATRLGRPARRAECGSRVAPAEAGGRSDACGGTGCRRRRPGVICGRRMATTTPGRAHRCGGPTPFFPENNPPVCVQVSLTSARPIRPARVPQASLPPLARDALDDGPTTGPACCSLSRG